MCSNAQPHQRLRWHYFLLWQMIGFEIWHETFIDAPASAGRPGARYAAASERSVDAHEARARRRPSTTVQDFWESHVNNEYYTDADAGVRRVLPRDRGAPVRDALPPARPLRVDWPAATASCSRSAAASASTASSSPKCGFDVTAVDLTENALEVAREFAAAPRTSTIDFRLGNAEGLDFPDASFDAVYSFGVLHHTPDIERPSPRCTGCCGPGGTAYVMLYHRDSLVNLVHRVFRLPYESPRDRKDHCPVVYTFSRREVRTLFRAILEACRCTPTIRSPTGSDRSRPRHRSASAARSAGPSAGT